MTHDIKIPNKSDFLDILRPHTQLIGEIVFNWNALHHNLSDIFWRVTGIANGYITNSIWNSVSADIAQRKMLKAAAVAKYNENSNELDDLIWLLNTIDNISINRNTAIHAPLSFIVNLSDGGSFAIKPNPSSTSSHATRLNGKDLVSEFTKTRDQLAILAKYAHHVSLALAPSPSCAWPKRPSLPSRKQKDRSEEKNHRRQSASKSQRQRAKHQE